MPRFLRLLLIAGGIIAFHATSYGNVEKITAQLNAATTEKDLYSQIELLRRLLDEKPGNGEAHQRLVHLWVKVSDYTMAEDALAHWPNAPKDLTARVHAMTLYYRDDNLEGAIQTLNDYLKTSPKDELTLKDLVKYLASAKQWQAQIKALDTLIVMQPTAERLLTRANAKRALQDYTGALSDAFAAQYLDPESSPVKSAMPAYERLNTALKAIQSLTANLQANPNDLKSLLIRAGYYQYGGMPELALQDADAALKIAPNSDYAKIIKARSLYAIGKIDYSGAMHDYKVDINKSDEKNAVSTAIIECDIALAKDPKNTGKLQMRAFLLNDDIGQYAMALESAKMALQIDPHFSPAMLEALYATTMLRNFEGAKTWLRELQDQKASPKILARALSIMANMYFKNTNYALALEFADQSLKREELRETLLLKASCLQRLGRQKDAEAILKRAAALKEKK
ncbi:MAG: hypothetical protein ABI443_00420 [Chthoniobacterales bacterium]